MSDKKILITGSEGYFGTALKSYLNDKDIHYRCLDTDFFSDCFLFKEDSNKDLISKDARYLTRDDLYGIDTVVHLSGISNDPFGGLHSEDIYDFSDIQKIDIDTLSHEAGAAQMEINFNHGEALTLADQALIFKRTIRQTALNHQIHATFMAKPIENEPGSAMHIHHSLVDMETGKNAFSGPQGGETELFFNFIGGLQTYIPSAIALLAPYVNSYRRYVKEYSAPINLSWARDCLLYTSPSPRDRQKSRMPSSA